MKTTTSRVGKAEALLGVTLIVVTMAVMLVASVGVSRTVVATPQDESGLWCDRAFAGLPLSFPGR